MRNRLVRVALVATMVAAFGVAFSPAASAVGCDNHVGPVSYGDDVKPVDICLSVAGVQTEVMLTPNPAGATGGQYVCILSVCQATSVYLEATGATTAFVAGDVCNFPTICLEVGGGLNNGNPDVYVCYVNNVGGDCIVDVRAPVRKIEQ